MGTEKSPTERDSAQQDDFGPAALDDKRTRDEIEEIIRQMRSPKRITSTLSYQ